MSIGIVETARRVARYQWIEERLFELLGAWTVVVPEPEAKIVLGPHAARHAEHAEAWARCRPDVREAGPAGAEPPGATVEAAFDALRDLDGPGRTIERLAGVYGVVLPELLDAYRAHLGRAVAVSDGPVIRVLERVVAEEIRERAEGEAVLQSLLVDADAIERAARQRTALAALLPELLTI